MAEGGLGRASHDHREIYLGDPRRTVREKLKTILRVALPELKARHHVPHARPETLRPLQGIRLHRGDPGH